MIRLYLDVHVPRALEAALRGEGIDVLTALEDGARTWSDLQLLRRAAELDRVLVTQDTDFLRLARAWAREARDFSGVVFAPQSPASLERYIEDLVLLARASESDELRGGVVFLPL